VYSAGSEQRLTLPTIGVVSLIRGASGVRQPILQVFHLEQRDRRIPARLSV
jgi:hypothetical protein